MNFKFAIATVAVSTIIAGQAVAQSDGDDERLLDEITVTATKRETSLSETPLPISALGDEALSRMGAAGFEDYFAAVPSLSMIDVGPGKKRYTLRGVQGPGEAQVGLYYDEIPVTGPPGENLDSGAQQPDIKLWDIERIEVLRGPQGTLYGNGSMGGTIRVITKKPNASETEFGANALFSSTEGGGTNYEVKGLANFPLVEDKLALRITGYHVDYDGFIDNERLGSFKDNTEETSGGRAALRWDINDASSLTATAYFQTMSTGGPFEFNRAITTSDSDLKGDRFIPQPFEDESTLYNITYDHSYDWGDWVMSVSNFQRDLDDSRDTTPDTGNGTARDIGEPAECTVRSQEFCSQAWFDAVQGRIPGGLGLIGGVDSTTIETRFVSNSDSAFRWATGVYYQNRESTFELQFGGRDPNNLAEIAELLFARENTRTSKQTAVFAEVEYDFTDRLTMITGLRWSKYEIDEEQYTLWSNFPPFGPPILEPVFRGDISSSESNVLPKVSLALALSDNANAYVLYSEGFRAGGPNAPGGDQDPPPFKSDSTKNYELGLKTTWLDGAAALNLAVFRIDWEDIQVLVDDVTGSFDFITNFGDAEINGIEVDATYYVPDSGFSFMGQLSLNDTGLVGDQPSSLFLDIGGVPTELGVSDPGQDGDPIPNVPEWNAYLSVNYDRQLQNGWDFYSYLDWQFTDSARTTFSTESTSYAKRMANRTSNLRLGMHKDGLELALFVRNITNAITDQGVNVAEEDVPFSITTRPRTIGLEATWHF